MKKVIFVLAMSGLVSFSSFAASTVAGKSDSTEFTKGGDKKKKKSKSCCSTDEKSKCCEKKADEKKKDEQPK